MNLFRYHILALIITLITCRLSSQTLVSMDMQPKNAVLEEFTGIHCGYCPDGHAIAQAMIDNNPNRVVVISVHQGIYAVPGESEPDYRTSWGDSIAIQAGVTGYPMGTVNRHRFNGSNTAMSRGDWTVSANEILNEISPVNIGVQSTYDSLTRNLNITVELFYTANSQSQSNRLSVALLQNHVFGPQLGGGAGDNYEHMHMLRDMITGQWGEEIHTTTQGTFIQKQYDYNIPQQINSIPVIAENCEIAVFVSEDHQEIYSGAVVGAVNGTTLHIGNVSILDTVQVKKGVPDELTHFSLTTKSVLTGEEEFQFVIESIDKPDDWKTTFDFDGQTYTDTALIRLHQNITEQIRIDIKPGSTAKLVEFVIKMRSISHPEAPDKISKIYVISGVTDMIVNGTGGPETGYYDYVFSDGLISAGCNSYAATDANILITGMNDRAFTDIKNIYLNIAWTFPSLTLEQLKSIKEFMDNGGNLLISGQDIGWDFMSGAANSHGSNEATDFFQNYLFAEYLNDGSSSNNILYVNSSDNVYTSVPDVFLVDLYDGNMYPDNIAAREGADEVFYYQSNDHAAAVKAENEDFKVIYFGVGLEMVGQTPITNQIISLTYYWFNNSLSTEEFDEALSKLKIGQNYPNPTGGRTTIPLILKNDGELKIYSSESKELMSIQINKEDSEIVLDLHKLKSGLYFYQINCKDEKSEWRKIILY